MIVVIDVLLIANRGGGDNWIGNHLIMYTIGFTLVCVLLWSLVIYFWGK